MHRRAGRGRPRVVRLYLRAGCHLCDETYRALRRAALELPLEIERIDVDTDEALQRRYTLRVPVVAVGADELEAAGVEDAVLVRWLRDRCGAAK